MPGTLLGAGERGKHHIQGLARHGAYILGRKIKHKF